MRTVTALGLLAVALTPLAIDLLPDSKAGAQSAKPALATAGTNDIHVKIQQALFTMERNSEIERAMRLSAKARAEARAARRESEIAKAAHDRRRAIERAAARAGTLHMTAFTAARNAEIRRSLAAYEGARDALFADARNRDSVVGAV